MTNQYKAPRVLAIVGGVIIFLILLIAFFSLAQVVKSFGNIFLFIPDQLGILQTVKRTEIAEVNMQHPPTYLQFDQPGLYTVYTVDYDLLVINDELIAHQAEPWLKIKEMATGQYVQVDYVERGLRIYDTPLAKGRPIHLFFIKDPGLYEISHLTRDASIFFLPDYLTGNEDLLAFSYLAQFAALVLIAGYFYQRHARQQAEKVRQVKQLKKIGKTEENDFWKKYHGKAGKNKKDPWR